MNKSLSFLILLIVSNIGYSQEQKEHKKSIIEQREEFISKTADSLNHIAVSENFKIPNLFLNPEFDFEIGQKFWTSGHSAISIRKLIIDKINNMSLIDFILQSKDKRLFKTTKQPEGLYLDIPFRKYSTFEIVKFRREEVLNNHSGL